jgi:hypothetical protein
MYWISADGRMSSDNGQKGGVADSQGGLGAGGDIKK